jgi:copper chaperone CopZ
MASVTGTFHVSGIRCERCVLRLASALDDQPGLTSAHANLMGEVTLTWDDDLTTRETLARALSASGFHERVPV